jgi:hypothetical protein
MIICRRRRFAYLIIYPLLISLTFFLLPEVTCILAYQQTGDDLLEQGKQYYQEGKFEEAIETLSLALKMLSDKDKLVDAYLHSALSHFALGEKEKAREDLAGLLRLNPKQQLDPMYYPPDFVQLLNEAKGAILAHFSIETEPSEAQVYLDGELRGLSPLELKELSAGEHKLVVMKEGYKAEEESVIVKEGEKKAVSFKLEKNEKKGKPAVAVTPKEKKPEVKKSRSWLWILLGGAAAAAVAILATRGGKETGPSTPALSTQTFGTIRIKSVPTEAEIFLDGNNTGFKTNHTIIQVPTGQHTIRLEKNGWKNWKQEVYVEAHQTTELQAFLLPRQPLNILFRDNFQDGNAQGWELNDGAWRVEQDNGNYVLSVPTGNQFAFATLRHPGWHNYNFKSKVKFVSGDIYCELCFRIGEVAHYWLGINADKISLNKEYSGAGNFERLAEGDVSLSHNEWYDFEIVTNNEKIIVYVNNSQRIYLKDNDANVSTGTIAFEVHTNTHIYFDDVLIYMQ